MQSLGNYSDRQPLILVVEDEIQVLQELTAILTKAGYLTRSCSTAEEAIAATREIKADLIISDVVIHEQGGLEICEQIKHGAEPGDMPVMFLSTNQIPDIIRRRGPLGGSYYLRKPFDPDVLLELLAKALNSTRMMAWSVR
jgi:CheY-like chemotaxis protein